MAKLKKQPLPGNQFSSFPPQTLSVCMIVKNEEEALPDCLSSIQGLADEIVIVDTGSTDNTKEIARSFGAKIIDSDWRDDFSFSRNISLEHATCSWILWLDADDRLDASACANIKRLKLEITNLVTVFGFKVKNVSSNGLGDLFMQVRMFPNDKRLRFEWPIHEQIILSADRAGYRTLYLSEVEILHTGYHDEAIKRKKALRNRAILEREMPRLGHFPSFRAAYGDTFAMRDEWEEAIKAYQSVLEIPDCKQRHSDIHDFMFVTIALGYKHLGKSEEALQWVDKGLKNTPEKLELLFLGGDTSFDSGDWDRAFGYYTQALRVPEAISTTPVDPVALKSKILMRLSQIHRKRKELDSAKHCLEQLTSLNNGFFDIPASFGEIYLDEGKILDAFKSFSESVLRFPGADIRAYRNLAEISAKLGRPDEAQNFYEKGLSFFPAEKSILESYKNFLRERGDMERYLDISRKLTGSTPQPPIQSK